ncbi:MAG: transglutaminase family protein [Pseudomonadota bacterium]
MRITVDHRTTYRYDTRPRRVMQLLRLTPVGFEGQTVGDWSIDLNCDAALIEKRDAHCNVVHLMTVEDVPEEVVITARGTVDRENTNGVVAGLDEMLPPLVYLQDSELTRANAKICAFAEDVIGNRTDPLERAHALLAGLYDHMTFSPGTTDVTTTAADAFDRGTGVCQDLSHLFCATARAASIPARYVSGHLYRQDGQNDQEAAHAWAEAWVDGLGWVSFDPAHGISTDEHYVRLAVGMDYLQAAPVVGTRAGGGMETLTVAASTRAVPLRNAQSQSQIGGGGFRRQSQQQQ